MCPPVIIKFVRYHGGSQPGAALTGIGLANLPGALDPGGPVYFDHAEGADAAMMSGARTGTPEAWQVRNVMGQNTGAPAGVARMDGVDYDVATYWKGPGSGNPISNTCDPSWPGTWTNPECGDPGLTDASHATYPGYVRIKINLNRVLTQEEIDAIQLGYRASYLDEQERKMTHSSCFGDNCSVVPEPITMILLGTGLAGIGGAGLIRRRRQNGDVARG